MHNKFVSPGLNFSGINRPGTGLTQVQEPRKTRGFEGLEQVKFPILTLKYPHKILHLHKSRPKIQF